MSVLIDANTKVIRQGLPRLILLFTHYLWNEAMKNITLALDEQVLERVRRVAVDRRTTVTGLVREYLERIAAEEDRRTEARRELRRLSDTSEARLGLGFIWNREDAYDRSILRGHERPDLCGDSEK